MAYFCYKSDSYRPYQALFLLLTTGVGALIQRHFHINFAGDDRFYRR